MRKNKRKELKGYKDKEKREDANMRIVAGTACKPVEPSSHRVRNQNRQILHVDVAKLNQYKIKFTI